MWLVKHQGTILREKMAKGTVMCPGAWNGLVATAIKKRGFDACYISGAATANAAGYPDIGLISLSEMCHTIRKVSDASNLPVIADADTGFGDLEAIAKTVVEYERNGAAGLHLEDQVFPKRCGHLDGKTIVPIESMVEKVSVAVQSKPHDDFLIIARTDARGVDGMEAAIERGLAYKEAGADMLFPEGMQSEEEFAEFAEGCKGLLLANMTEFGKTPDITLKRFSEIGYDLVIYPVTMQRVAMGAITSCLEQLQREESASGFESQMHTRKELYDLLDYVPEQEWQYPHK